MGPPNLGVAEARVCSPRGAPSFACAAVDPRLDGSIWRHRRARRCPFRRRARRDLRADRPQRRRQDHAVQLPVATLSAAERRRSASRAAPSSGCAARDRAPRHRPDVPEPGAVRHHDGARERHDRRRTAIARGGFLVNALALPSARREERRIARARVRLDRGIRLDRGRRHAGRRACLSARASGSSWRARWRCEPKLLLLDEPAGGLNHEEVDALRGEIRGDSRPPRHHACCWSSIT